MPVDYSKWDALELSDDSDIEVHPNVDKKSFIRARQNQIHQQRHERRLEIETLKYERIINDGLLERINALLDALKNHQAEADKKNPDELVFQALIESAGDPAKDDPPKAPQGVYTQQKEPQPKYSKMMGSLVDQVKKDVDEKKSPDRYKDYVEGVFGHLTKVQKLQQELLEKLAQLEREEKSKITSESIHEGFNSSHVSKGKSPPATTSSTTSKSTTNGKSKSVELLNAPKPKAVAGLSSTSRSALQRADSTQDSGAEADVEDEALISQHEQLSDEDEDVDPEVRRTRLTPLARAFGKIKPGDWTATLRFISKHPEINTEDNTDALLVEAFNACMKGNDKWAKTCVHQGLLLQYCRQLGPDGVALFFKRVTNPSHQGFKMFQNDVNEHYGRIHKRALELKAHDEADAAAGEQEVEQIQLHAVDPGTSIHINLPQPNSTEPIEIEARKVFESFPKNFQKALETGSLDEVNKVLGQMPVSEAEDIVGKLGESGMLSMQEGVIDATNEEGRKKLAEMEEEERVKRAKEGSPMEGVEGGPGGAVEEPPQPMRNVVDEVD